MKCWRYVKKKEGNLIMYTDETIQNELKKIVLEMIEDDTGEISFEDSFYSLGLNSIDRIRLVVEIEKKYGIEIEDDEDYAEENFININTVTKVVQKYL